MGSLWIDVKLLLYRVIIFWVGINRIILDKYALVPYVSNW